MPGTITPDAVGLESASRSPGRFLLFALPAWSATFVRLARGKVSPLRRVSRDSFSSLIARVRGRIVVRVPFATR